MGVGSLSVRPSVIWWSFVSLVSGSRGDGLGTTQVRTWTLGAPIDSLNDFPSGELLLLKDVPSAPVEGGMRYSLFGFAFAAVLGTEVWHVVRPPGGGCLPPVCRDGQWPMATPVLVHGNRFVMIGDGADPQRIYESSDGARWRPRRTNASWGARYESADASFADALWRTGGFEPRGEQRTYFNDVWRSGDGVTWHRITAAAPWSPRADAHLVAFRDSLWLVGGEPNDGVVWSTRDGVTWVAHRATGLPRRPPQAVLVFNDALWILGHGRWREATNDVWTSADGAVWHEVRSEAPWLARTDPGFGVAKGRLWVIAGAGHRDVWSSGDGRQWARSHADLPGPPRTADFVASHRDGVWVFGGKTGGAGATGFWDGIYVLR